MISGDPGTPPRYAVPDFVALTPDAAEIAKTIGQVLWDDLNFEREFYMIPRDTYGSVPAARTPEQVPFAAWRELGADAVVFGTVQRTGNDVRDAGAAVQRADAAVGLREGVQRHARTIRGCTPTRSPTRFTSSSAGSRVSRAPSSPSCPIAMA